LLLKYYYAIYAVGADFWLMYRGWESVYKKNELTEESEQSYYFYSQINPVILINELLYVRHIVMFISPFFVHVGSMWRICWHQEWKMDLLSYIPASIEWLVLRNHILERFKSVSLLPSRYIYIFLFQHKCMVFSFSWFLTSLN
jgi:hypothetical protein